METVVVKLGLALICFGGQCQPALVGASTPVGEFVLHQRKVLDSGYGGDVLQFDEDATFVWAVHRVWTGKPSENRVQRLKSTNPEDRKMTNGCINVMPDVYEKLKECCSESTLVIEE